jgi:hypothetical protein
MCVYSLFRCQLQWMRRFCTKKCDSFGVYLYIVVIALLKTANTIFSTLKKSISPDKFKSTFNLSNDDNFLNMLKIKWAFVFLMK